jgi:hypothetical protein
MGAPQIDAVSLQISSSGLSFLAGRCLKIHHEINRVAVLHGGFASVSLSSIPSNAYRHEDKAMMP